MNVPERALNVAKAPGAMAAKWIADTASGLTALATSDETAEKYIW